ncbi:MAG: cellulase family glycosylhydrolase, partial [Bacteroidales bacterium]|nr:cellulase family glycosylhydrolase [Candidatus Scybalocola fimicaballi]
NYTMIKLLSKWILCALMAFLFCFNLNAQNYPANSPVAINGKLKVSGTQLVNECGNAVQLRGMSTHGPQWFGQCYNKSAISTLVKDWGISVFRWAMYVEENGYITNPSGFRSKIDEMVDICGELGIYCLIDWHVLTPGDPNAHKTEALEFWKYMSQKHGNKAHVLYEICNEPNKVEWGTVKNYANDVIKAIRDNNDQTVIIVGTPTWSQDVDVAGANKLSGTNIMYTLHFYAGTHKDYLRQKAQTALNNNTPIFVTEFGTSDASGDNAYSPDETKTWINWLNERKISWICWSFSDHREVSAALVPGSCSGSNWNNVSTTGQLIKGLISANKIPYVACNGQGGNNNNNQQQPDQNQNNNNNNWQDPNQNQNNNNNNWQDPNQNQNNNNNNQQQEQPVTYPELVQEITNGDVYRIVNKKSGKVMSIADGSDLKQVNRDENDKNQQFRLKETDGYYFIQRGETKIMLTNKYVNNDGTKISSEELSNYDNPSQKWSFKKVNDWFMFSNKTDQSGNKVLAVENASKQDNANVVLFSKNNQDEQLWGLEYVYTPDPASVDDVISMDIYAPTVIEDEFHIVTTTGEGVVVDIYTVSGIHVKHFLDECTYNVSDLAKGNYVVVVSRSNGQRILSQLIIKK